MADLITDKDGNVDSKAAANLSWLSALGAHRAYNDQANALNNNYNNSKKMLGANYNAALSSLQSDYNNSVNSVNNSASDSLKQAYINNMMGQKNLKQKLAAQGINGGATESTVARLINAYGNNRNSINNAKNSYLANLSNTYNQNRASALQSYNSALANLQNSFDTQKSQLNNQLYDRFYQNLQDYGRSQAYDDNLVNNMIAGYMYGQPQNSPSMTPGYLYNAGANYMGYNGFR